MSSTEPLSKKLNQIPQKSPILFQAKDTLKHAASFVDAKDLNSLSSTCKQFHTLFNPTMLKKKKAHSLLEHVFNADPKKVIEFLSQEMESDLKSSKSVSSSSSSKVSSYKPYKSNNDILCLVLTKSRCKEGYDSIKLKRKMYKRLWLNISPLEAAAWCGDNFLVRELLKYVPPSERIEAYLQLHHLIYHRVTENGPYMAPYEALVKAYVDFIEKFQTLLGHQASGYRVKEDEMKIINLLWNQVWIRQRLLPTYGWQEYSNVIPFFPKPTFDKEPTRLLGRVFNPTLKIKDEEDLDSMPFGRALLKANASSGAYICPTYIFIMISNIRDIAIDADAIINLYNVRRNELINIRSSLLKPLEEEDEPKDSTDISRSDDKKCQL